MLKPAPPPKNAQRESAPPEGADAAALWEMVTQTQDMLAQASQVNERLLDVVADLAARLYCIEIGLNMRRSGSFDYHGLQFLGGTSVATYQHMRRRVLVEKLGIPVPEG